MAKTSPGEFVRQVRAETAKVSWPTRRETITTTIMVLIMATVLAIFFLGVDAYLGAWLRPGSSDTAGIFFMLLGGRTLAEIWSAHTAALIATLPIVVAGVMLFGGSGASSGAR